MHSTPAPGGKIRIGDGTGSPATSEGCPHERTHTNGHERRTYHWATVKVTSQAKERGNYWSIGQVTSPLFAYHARLYGRVLININLTIETRFMA